MEQEDLAIFTEICNVRKCYKKGQEPDYLRASQILIEEFRAGKIGKVTLELPSKKN